MIWRNWLCALIGVWFIAHEWVFHGTPNPTATFWTSVIIGIVQVIVSIWANGVRNPSWQVWQNWVSSMCGLYFVVAEPFMEDYEVSNYWAIVIPGIITLALNLWTMMARRHSDQVGTRV